MHPRHRNPGNGFRSMGMGGGVAAASGISPDGGDGGRGSMYNSDYRNYNNRGFGRGQSKPPFQHPLHKGGDVFVEAGRLATDYLVSKGVLPPNVYSGKWKNGGLKNQGGNFQSFREQGGDVPAESGISAVGHAGDAASNDVGPGSKRRFGDDYSLAELRNYMGRRRRMGLFKGHNAEWNRDFGRSSSWYEKSRVSPDKDNSDGAFYGYQEDQQVNEDGGNGEQKSQSGKNASRNDRSGNSESHVEKLSLADDLASQGSSSTDGNDLLSETDQKPTDKPETMEILSLDMGEVKDDNGDNEMEKQIATEELPAQEPAEDNPTKNNGSDLLSLCTFAKVPTRTRSSLAIKGLKMNPEPISEVRNTNDNGVSLGPMVHAEDPQFDGSSGDASSNQTQSTKILDPDISEEMPKEDAGDLVLSYAVGKGKCPRSKSFPERSSMKEQESSEGPPGFGRCTTMDTQRGEKRAIQLNDNRDVIKRPREVSPTKETHPDNFVYLSTSMQKQEIKPEGSNSSDVTDNKLLDVSLFSNGAVEPIEFTDEKQLFPGSFKICDLNLIEASDPNENVNPLMNFPPIPHCEKEALRIDIDLSMSNSCICDKFQRRGVAGKEVEVIDLENDSVQDDKALTNPEQKNETLFTGLESFSNNAQVNGIPDVQDGYGMMISELLRTDLPDCSSVPPDVNSLQNEMGLNSGEGMLGDDDSIYMSLGEIPISMPEL